MHRITLLGALTPVVAAGVTSAERYERVGNGWCLDRHGNRLKLGPDPFTHVDDIKWTQAEVALDGSAQHCEARCSRLPDCVGYMTEDFKSCDIVRRRDHHASRGIASADSEKRNYCWERVKGAELDLSSTCEVTATWPDGRREARECVTLAVR